LLSLVQVVVVLLSCCVSPSARVSLCYRNIWLPALTQSAGTMHDHVKGSRLSPKAPGFKGQNWIHLEYPSRDPFPHWRSDSCDQFICRGDRTRRDKAISFALTLLSRARPIAYSAGDKARFIVPLCTRDFQLRYSSSHERHKTIQNVPLTTINVSR
jgi:hypothetical protein